MEKFFSDTKVWPAGGPFPHFLVLLCEYPEYRAYARAHHHLLGQYPHLAIVPEEWLHATVQGIHHTVTAEQTEQLQTAARKELAGMRPFRVQLGPTWPGITAITVAIYPEAGMAELNARAQASAASVPGITLRPSRARHWPHTTLAYARAESTDDRQLNRALRELRPERVELVIDRVHLVSQSQDLTRGIYTWDVVEKFVFADS